MNGMGAVILWVLPEGNFRLGVGRGRLNQLAARVQAVQPQIGFDALRQPGMRLDKDHPRQTILMGQQSHQATIRPAIYKGSPWRQQLSDCPI